MFFLGWYFFVTQDALLTSGHLSQDQYDKLIAQQRALEDELRHKNDARKTQQLDAIRVRVAQRKAKRLADLKEKHERDKNKVCKSASSSSSTSVL